MQRKIIDGKKEDLNVWRVRVKREWERSFPTRHLLRSDKGYIGVVQLENMSKMLDDHEEKRKENKSAQQLLKEKRVRELAEKLAEEERRRNTAVKSFQKVREPEVKTPTITVPTKYLPVGVEIDAIKMDLKDILTIGNNDIKIEQVGVGDSFRDFGSDTFRLSNVADIESFYDAFESLRKTRSNAALIIRTGDIEVPRYIFVNQARLRSLQTFVEFLNDIENGEYAGSDRLGADEDIDFTYMTITWFDNQGFARKSPPKCSNYDPMFDKGVTTKDCLYRSVIKQFPELAAEIPKDVSSAYELARMLQKLNYDLTVYADIPYEYRIGSVRKLQYPELAHNGKDCRHWLDDGGLCVIWTTIWGNKNTVFSNNLDTEKHIELYKNPEKYSKNHVQIVYYKSHFVPYNGPLSGAKFAITTSLDLEIHTPNDKGTLCYRTTLKRKDINVDLTDVGAKSRDMGIAFMRQEDEKKSKRRQFCIYSNKLTQLGNPGFSHVVISYDVETYFDDKATGVLKVYSISWTCGGCVSEDLAKNTYVNFASGEGCLDKFIEYLLEIRKNRLITLLGYNSSRFDNIFLIPMLIKNDLLDDVFFQGNAVLNIKWGGRHNTHDICRFTQSTLERACTEFKTKYKKVGDFNHHDIQAHFLKTNNVHSYFHEPDCQFVNGESVSLMGLNVGKLEESIAKGTCQCKKFRDLIVYNAYDVLAAQEIYEKIECVLRACNVIDEKSFLADKKTIGSVIYSQFSKQEVVKRIRLLDEAKYKAVRSGLVAGRTQCYKNTPTNKISYDLTRDTKYVMVDVKSLYPYVMLNRDYPVGDITVVSYSECVQRDLIGFYRCRICQKGLSKKILPKREKGHPLNWNFSGIIESYINTVDIKCLIDYGAAVEILKDADGNDDGFAFVNKISGADLFACQNEWKKIKEGEDKKPAAERNNVLRNMAKAFLNSLSGKVIENIHLDKTVLVRDRSATVRKMIDSGITDINYSRLPDSNACIVSYTKPFSEEFKSQNRPIYLGTLIYAYARDHMYRSVLADYDVIYQDTDSALMSAAEYERFCAEKPALVGEQFGQFALEDNSEKFDSYITLSPKNYFILGQDKDEYKVLKKGFKGVNLTRDRYIADPANYPGIFQPRNKTREDSNGAKYDLYSMSQVGAYALHNGGKWLDAVNEHAGTEHKQPPTVLSCYRELFDDIITKGYAYVLTSALRKVVRTTPNSKLFAGMIYQVFTLKRITINNPQDEFEVGTVVDELPQGGLVHDNVDIKLALEPLPIGLPAPFTKNTTVRYVSDKHTRDFTSTNVQRIVSGKGFSAATEPLNADEIAKLMYYMGAEYNLNEFPQDYNGPTKVFIDIDMPIKRRFLAPIYDALKKYCSPDSAPKMLLSTKNKLHIVISAGYDNLVEEILNFLVYKTVPSTSMTELNRLLNGYYSEEDNMSFGFIALKYGIKEMEKTNGDGLYSDRLTDPYTARKYRKEMYPEAKKLAKQCILAHFRGVIFRTLDSTISWADWAKAFDLRACGLRAPYSVKVVDGEIADKNFYIPLTEAEIYNPSAIVQPELNFDDYESRIEMAKKTVEYSIYGEVQQYNEDFCRILFEDYFHYVIAPAIQKNMYVCELMKDKSFQIGNKKIKLTQQTIDAAVSKFNPKYSWHKVVLAVKTLSKLVGGYDPKYVLHTWSQQDPVGYNAARNESIWRSIKNYDVEKAIKALYLRSKRH